MLFCMSSFGLKLRIMNLQNLNVAELSAQEVRETEGGIIPFIIGACIILLATNGCSTTAKPGCASAKRFNDDVNHTSNQ